MKKTLLFLLLASCNSGETEKNFSTVDSNVLTADSNTLKDTDNPYDSTYSVALDSNIKTITPADTGR